MGFDDQGDFMRQIEVLEELKHDASIMIGNHDGVASQIKETINSLKKGKITQLDALRFENEIREKYGL